MPDTKLDAVNEMLEAIGLPAVDALDTGGTSEEAEAEVILNRVNKRIQSQGWAQNTLPKVVYSPDNNKITFATDVLRATPVGASRRLKVAMRDGALYDLENNTDEFQGDVELEIVELIDFEKLTPTLRDYITKVARVEFQRFKKRGQIDDTFAAQEMAEARVRAIQEDSDLRRVNVLNTPEARRVKGDRNTLPTSQLGAII